VRSIVVAAFACAVALTAVLVRLADPAYQDYTIRQQVAAGIELAKAKKNAIVAEWEAAGRDFSNVHFDATGTSLEGRSKYVTSVEVVSGTTHRRA
jgi:type IV pilus assembly protein PilA